MQGNASDPITTFPLARYRLEWQATTPIRLPDYAGSMLRGAFGHALRKLACMTKQRDCAGCPLLSSCPYPAIFAPPPPAAHKLQKFSQIPVPYIIEPPAWGARQLGEGEAFAFHLVLIGRALRELPLILLAWRRAFARGVGTGSAWLAECRVACRGENGFVRHSDESPDRYLAIYEVVVGRNHPSMEKARLATRHGLEPAQFEQNRSKINRRLAASLSLASAPYKVCTQGERPLTRYGIALPPARIIIQ